MQLRQRQFTVKTAMSHVCRQFLDYFLNVIFLFADHLRLYIELVLLLKVVTLEQVEGLRHPFQLHERPWLRLQIALVVIVLPNGVNEVFQSVCNDFGSLKPALFI